MSLTVANHREQLSDAILAGFEDRGWQWSDEQLIEGIRKSFQEHEKEYCYPREAITVAVGRRICRLFGDSQVVPVSDKVLGGLAKSLATEMKLKIEHSHQDDHTVALHYLTRPQLHQEIDALASSKEVFPIAFGYSLIHCPTLAKLYRLASDNLLVSHDCRISIAFKTVLWVIAMASKAASSEYGYLQGLRETDPKQISNYLAYRDAEKAAQATRAELRTRLPKLIPELRAIIFDEMAGGYIPGCWSYFDGNEIPDEARKAVEMLGDLDFTPLYEDRFPHEPKRKDSCVVNVQELLVSFQHEMESVITTNREIAYDIEAISQSLTRPGNFLPPSPVDLHRGRFVRDLHLRIGIDDSFPRRTQSPSSLYNAQQYVPRLKDFFPGLKTLQVQVTNNNDEHLPILMRHSEMPGEMIPTTIEEEMEKLVQSILKLNLARKEVRYHQYQAYGYSLNSVEGNATRSMTITEFVRMVMRWEGLRVQVSRVEEGLADVREAIVEELGVTEPELRE
ncbi:hypothetical protein PRZ48_008803 [Zasmidium cellare]|uniref:Uncharacterized protein n=1 Tax=Zasmidium cellare TaxID=395010 RepID=A0ABR0EGH0_ZASCE|nr:hypothetical protein PRZ48_008803 [Zasmidium cellare]